MCLQTSNYDFDEWLEELDLDDWDVIEWIGNEWESGDCHYLELESQEVVDHYQDYKRGYESTLFIYKCPDGKFWGFQSTFYPLNENTVIDFKGRMKKRRTKKTEWKLIQNSGFLRTKQVIFGQLTQTE